MKQIISVEDLQELTEKQRNALRIWWSPKPGDLYYSVTRQGIICYGLFEYNKGDDRCVNNKEFKMPALNIGQMIELLSSKVAYLTTQNYGKGCTVEYETYNPLKEDFYYDEPELCDALWQAIKQVL